MRSVEITSCSGAETANAPMMGAAEPTSTSGSPLGGVVAPYLAGGTFALLLIVGTGGLASAASASSAITDLGLARTGSVFRVDRIFPSRKEEERDAIAESAEGLAFIQHHLSLNLSDLAIVLRVSRPTVYSWLREESAPQAHNLARMRLLYTIARTWAAISPTRLGVYLKRPALDGRSVLDMLSAEKIDKIALRDELTSISKAIESKRGEQRPRSANEIAKQFGLQTQSKHSQEESIAQETGL